MANLYFVRLFHSLLSNDFADAPYSYSMKWYSYSKDGSETPQVNVPAANALRYFENDVRS